MSDNIIFFISKDYKIANIFIVWFQICDNRACERDKDGRLCGGCGICKCGKCDCGPCKLGDPNMIGDPGDTCECSLKKCRAPDDPRICSANGVCACDTCDCNDRYTGNSSFTNNIGTAISVCLNVIDPMWFFQIFYREVLWEMWNLQAPMWKTASLRWVCIFQRFFKVTERIRKWGRRSLLRQGEGMVWKQSCQWQLSLWVPGTSVFEWYRLAVLHI